MPQDSVLQYVSQNVRAYRDLKGFSQQQLAEAAGISRRMIAGVESGQDNISLAKLSLIADALQISFAELVSAPERKQPVIHEKLWQGASPESYAQLEAAAKARQGVELWTWSLAPHESYQAEADPQGWQEMLLVLQGELTLEIGGESILLEKGQSYVYASDVSYRYCNCSNAPVTFIRNCVY